MIPLLANVDVQMFGALDPEGSTYHKCRIVSNGNPANAVLYQRIDGRWQVVDQLAAAKITDTEAGYEFTGTSRQLVDEVGLPPDQAQARWVVTKRGCSTC